MHLQQSVHSHHAAGFHGAHSPDHRVDVAEYLCGGDVPGVFTQLPRGIGAEQPASSHFQAFNAGRGDAFRAQQEPGQCLGVRQRVCSGVKPYEGGLGVGNVCGNVAVENKPASGQRVRQVNRVVAGESVAPG